MVHGWRIASKMINLEKGRRLRVFFENVKLGYVCICWQWGGGCRQLVAYAY